MLLIIRYGNSCADIWHFGCQLLLQQIVVDTIFISNVVISLKTFLHFDSEMLSFEKYYYKPRWPTQMEKQYRSTFELIDSNIGKMKAKGVIILPGLLSWLVFFSWILGGTDIVGAALVRELFAKNVLVILFSRSSDKVNVLFWNNSLLKVI